MQFTKDDRWKTADIIIKLIGYTVVTCITYKFLNLEIENTIDKNLKYEYLKNFHIEIQEQYERCTNLQFKSFEDLIIATQEAMKKSFHVQNNDVSQNELHNIIEYMSRLKFSTKKSSGKHKTCAKVINTRITTAAAFLGVSSEIVKSRETTENQLLSQKKEWEDSRDPELLHKLAALELVIESRLWIDNDITKDDIVKYLYAILLTLSDDYSLLKATQVFEYEFFTNRMKVITDTIYDQ